MLWLRRFIALFLLILTVCILHARESGKNLETNYVLRSFDRVSLTVFQEPDLDKEVRIEVDGSINLPLIGKVKVAGLTIADARERIRYLYNKDFLVNPQLSLDVTHFHPRKVDVIGQVNEPGPVNIPLEKDLTLVEAISLAKGFTRLAKRSEVQVTRVDKNGEKIVQVVNADRLMSDTESEDYILQEGDSIYVPERFL